MKLDSSVGTVRSVVDRIENCEGQTVARRLAVWPACGGPNGGKLASGACVCGL